MLTTCGDFAFALANVASPKTAIASDKTINRAWSTSAAAATELVKTLLAKVKID